MLVSHMVHDLLKEETAHEVHTVANVVAGRRAINFIQKVFVFLVRLCVGHFKHLRIPLTERALSLIVLNLLSNDGDWTAGIVLKSHAQLTNMKSLAFITIGRRDEAVLLNFERLEASPLHALITLFK